MCDVQTISALVGHCRSLYYDATIRQSNTRRVIIVTDDPWDPFFWRFRPFRPQFLQGSALMQLAFITSASNLVLSQSTLQLVGVVSRHSQERVRARSRFRGLG